MDWLTGTFKPFIDDNFRTLPDRKHTFIAGSSMGGLMSLYAVVKYNQFFSKAAALSPSLWVSAPKLSDMIKKARIRANTVVYMDYGAREFRNHEGIRDQFAAISTLLLKKKVLLETRIVPGGSHCEASWEKQIPFFMNTLLYEP